MYAILGKPPNSVPVSAIITKTMAARSRIHAYSPRGLRYFYSDARIRVRLNRIGPKDGMVKKKKIIYIYAHT